MNPMPLLLLAGGVLLCLLMAAAALRGPSTSKRARQRLENLRERFSQSDTVRTQVQMKRILSQRSSRLDNMMVRILPKPALLRQRLSRTGKSWTLGGYGAASSGIAMAVMLLCLLRGLPILLSLLLGTMLGLAIPHKLLSILINRRRARFTNVFPDAIDLLVRGLRSGLPISETLGVVAREVPDPVGTEFRTISDKIRIGRTMEQALQDSADRLGSPEFQFFVITLSIQRETGGNLSETLSNLSDVLRQRSQMRLKVKAMSSESKASAYIVGVLPFAVFTMIWFVNPPYMAKFFADPRLMIAGGGALVWMMIGAFIMSRMVSFEI